MQSTRTATDIRVGAREVWKALVDFPSWSGWTQGRIEVRGAAVPGSTLDVRLRDVWDRTWRVRPRVVEVVEFRRLVLAASWGPRRLLHLTHTLQLLPSAGERTRLVQEFTATGLLAPRAWEWLQQRWWPFEALGSQLGHYLDPPPPSRPVEEWERSYAERGLDFTGLLPCLVPVPGLEQELFQLQDDPEAGLDAALQRIEEGREYYRWAHNALSLDPSEYHTMLLYLDYLEEKLRRRQAAPGPAG